MGDQSGKKGKRAPEVISLQVAQVKCVEVHQAFLLQDGSALWLCVKKKVDDTLGF